MKIIILIIYFIVFCLWTNIHADENIIIHTNYGDILGYQTDSARVFRGIPYAQPPIGELRWNQPVTVSKWAPNVLNATARAPACPQPSCNIHSPLCPPVFSEDCLYINIFTPLSNSSSLSNLPVMIFIPGGSFQYLDASIPVYNAEHLVNTTNIVCVFVQYRLGALGFLASGNGPQDLKGNYGILDQRLAIAWIKENIYAFGGDSNRITLFGESAGAQSVALHYVTREMQPFFQGAIIQSSPMAVPFKTYVEYTTVNGLFAEQLHCGVGDFKCFRNASYQEIITAQKAVDNMLTTFKFLLFFETWVPVVDYNVVPGQLLDAIVNTSFALKPLMIGTVTEEGIAFVYGGWSKPMSATTYVEALLLAFRNHAIKVIERYPPDGTEDQRPLLSRIFTQWVFACPTRVFARKSASYLYVYDYLPDFDSWSLSKYCKNHVCHADELPYVLESAWYNVTDAGRRVSQSMATYWTNFGKTQNPNQPISVPITWLKLNTIGNYLYIQDPIDVRQDYLKKDCDFWDTIGYKHN